MLFCPTNSSQFIVDLFVVGTYLLKVLAVNRAMNIPEISRHHDAKPSRANQTDNKKIPLK